MGYESVDGVIFAKMMQNALNNLRLHEDEINKLNVFPVPDGDTGTNMRRTVEMGVEKAVATKSIGEYLKTLSSGMLLGARGNSGVILSQIFKGFSDALGRRDEASTSNLIVGFIKGYVAAYAAVIRPVEGTILTVAREGIEKVRASAIKHSSVEAMLTIYIAEMQKTLKHTPEMLPVLKEAGVVDSGGYGFILIVEGMLKCLYGEEIVVDTPAVDNGLDLLQEEVNDSFGVNSKFEYGYCMEFTLQLLNKKRPAKTFALDYFIEDLKSFGESIVAIPDGYRVRVHIHTLSPEKVIAMCRQYGEFVFFKLDNMELQHNEFVEAQKEEVFEHKKVAILAVADGDGFCELFKGLGADIVLKGGRTMNTSVKEFVDAFAKLNADMVLVLPNDKNIVNSARQAVQLYDGKVEVISSKSMVEGYFALASVVPESSPKQCIESMKEGIAGVTTIYVAPVTKDKCIFGLQCKAGDSMAFVDGNPVCSCSDLTESTLKALLSVQDIAQKEQIIVFTGGGTELPDDFQKKIEEMFPNLQIDVVSGGETGDLLTIGII